MGGMGLQYLLMNAPMVLPMTFYFWRVLDTDHSYGWLLHRLLLYFIPSILLGMLVNSDFNSNGPQWLILAYDAMDIAWINFLLHRFTKNKLGKVLLLYCTMVLLMVAGQSVPQLIDTLFLAEYLAQGSRQVITILFQVILQAGLVMAAAQGIYWYLSHHRVDIRWSTFSFVLIAELVTLILLAYFLLWVQNSIFSDLLYGGVTALVLASDIQLSRAFNAMVRNQELQQQIGLMEQQQNLQHEQYQAIGGQLTAMRRLRHDYKNTLTTIDTLIRQEHYGQALRLTNQSEEELSAINSIYTGVPVVDAVLYRKQEEAERDGIQLRTLLLLPEPMTVAERDLMVIFCNLLDNAIEYCRTLPGGIDRWVEVRSTLQGRLFQLSFSNPILEADAQSIDYSTTRKKDPENHGHGLAIVRTVTQRYDGWIELNALNGRFRADVLLSLPEASDGE